MALEKVRATACASMASGEHWPRRLAGLLGDVGATWQESAEVCADLAWRARAEGHSALLLLEPDQVSRADADPVTARTYRHVYAGTLRYDFRCRSIETLFHNMPGVDHLDCYSRALWAFALLGQSRTAGVALEQRVLDEAGDHPKSLHVLLHGLWLGHALPGREELMLQVLSRPPFAARTDPIALFREASVLRRLGRYRAALASINRALDLLPPGDPAVHTDFVRERALVCAADDLARISGHGAEGGPA
ncbi:hypothetical protein [Streptomyces sp. x-80]|uniref:hypothetical protein n=1 Tax=Streptomyces sp. x-80 TaxID=2789282 RepID=UPI003980AF0D